MPSAKIDVSRRRDRRDVAAHRVLVAAQKHHHITALHGQCGMALAQHLTFAVDEDVKEDDAFGFGHHGRRQRLWDRRFDRPWRRKIGGEKHSSRQSYNTKDVGQHIHFCDLVRRVRRRCRLSAFAKAPADPP